jgi:hypothetical protein
MLSPVVGSRKAAHAVIITGRRGDPAAVSFARNEIGPMLSWALSRIHLSKPAILLSH